MVARSSPGHGQLWPGREALALGQLRQTWHAAAQGLVPSPLSLSPNLDWAWRNHLPSKILTSHTPWQLAVAARPKSGQGTEREHVWVTLLFSTTSYVRLWKCKHLHDLKGKKYEIQSCLTSIFASLPCSLVPLQSFVFLFPVSPLRV